MCKIWCPKLTHMCSTGSHNWVFNEKRLLHMDGYLAKMACLYQVYTKLLEVSRVLPWAVGNNFCWEIYRSQLLASVPKKSQSCIGDNPAGGLTIQHCFHYRVQICAKKIHHTLVLKRICLFGSRNCFENNGKQNTAWFLSYSLILCIAAYNFHPYYPDSSFPSFSFYILDFREWNPLFSMR